VIGKAGAGCNSGSRRARVGRRGAPNFPEPPRCRSCAELDLRVLRPEDPDALAEPGRARYRLGHQVGV
jgi:hypothetical protein